MASTSPEASESALELVAFPVGDSEARIIPASHERDWMSDEMLRGPYRCLPLSIANSSGWMLLNEQAFTATWNGGKGAGSTKLLFRSRRPAGRYHATSVFGNGIVTFFVPFLFRTPPGYNLLVRGPANSPKDGVSPLEGIVETDWAVATFTMNWQVTRRNTPVVFEMDEPICMIVPQRRGELGRFQPLVRALDRDPRLDKDHGAWHASRTAFLRELNRRLSAPATNLGNWQRHYFQGSTVDGIQAPEHETKVRLRPFEPSSSSDSRI
jgi:hypothetical protein